jgi:hypothetical protein
MRRLAGGVAIAAAAGVLMGASLKPDLDEDPVEGPQQLISGGGPRTYVQASDPGLGVYQGKLPTYVVGTDHLPKAEPVVLAYDDRSEPALEESEGYGSDVMVYEAPVLQSAHWADAPRPAPRYPSQQGGAWHESDLPPAPDIPENSGESDHSPL